MLPKYFCLHEVPLNLSINNRGSNGLNLTEASHVILMEPNLNPAIELQAIGRVDRIGQMQETFVHRFIVADSVEETIWEMNQTNGSSASKRSVYFIDCLSVEEVT